MKTIYLKLINIQAELKAPKSQYNSFGKYKYRNCEDILEAVKPLLNKHKATLIISDEVTFIDGRHYIKSTATFIDIETGESIQTSAYAREEETKKGMDGSQVTGASSSYARKYCLNGLFLIDDTKDSDFTNTHDKENNTYTDNNSNNNNTYNSTNTQNSNKPISTAQANRLYAIAKGKGYTSEQVDKSCFNKLSKKVTELNKQEYDSIVQAFENAPVKC